MTVNILRQLRENMGLTQEQLAKKAKIAPRTVYRAEKGWRVQHASQRKILKALGLPFSEREAVFGLWGTPMIALPAYQAEQAERTARMWTLVDGAWPGGDP